MGAGTGSRRVRDQQEPGDGESRTNCSGAAGRQASRQRDSGCTHVRQDNNMLATDDSMLAQGPEERKRLYRELLVDRGVRLHSSVLYWADAY